MAHSHYVMDLYHDDGNPSALRREVLRITASDDAQAISEANRISGWRTFIPRGAAPGTTLPPPWATWGWPPKRRRRRGGA